MADPAHRSIEAAMRTCAPEAEAARVRRAASRIRALESIEQQLLDLAVRTTDDAEASWLELWADAAWRDAHALRSEHGDDSPWWTP